VGDQLTDGHQDADTVIDNVTLADPLTPKLWHTVCVTVMDEESEKVAVTLSEGKLSEFSSP
jgi:hypothetical protein